MKGRGKAIFVNSYETLIERKQNRETKKEKDFRVLCILSGFLICHLWMRYGFKKTRPFCLPSGKADDTASAVLSRVRRRRLQPNP